MGGPVREMEMSPPVSVRVSPASIAVTVPKKIEYKLSPETQPQIAIVFRGR